ncbi:hypothetical protein FQR65_LT00908 [Abscondita terminalis]|nr:hypothetical protein FQR65_LT00908 [Abscondita terminalis]
MNSNGILISEHLHQLIEKVFLKLDLELQPKLEVFSPLKPGDNWLGQLLAITATGKDDKQRLSTLNLMAKIAPVTKLHREVIDVGDAFAREAYMYAKVLPEFQNIQKEKNVKHVFAPFAKCYVSNLDKNEETLLLENMKLYGYRSINHRLPIDYEHTTFLIKALGKLHALSFALREHKPELFQTLGRNTRENSYSNFKNFILLMQNLGNRVLATLEKDSRAYKAFELFLEDPSFVIRDTINPELAGDYAVICHGDFQMRNFLFKYDDDSNPDTPTEMCLIDWQLSRFCSPCSDISDLMWICTDKKLRDHHYEEFMEMYYNSFSLFLKELGGCPEKSYSHRVFKEDLRKMSIGGMFLSIWHVLLNSLRAEDIPNISLHENVQDFVNLFLAAVNDRYLAKMKDVVEDFVKYGYDLAPNLGLTTV